MQVVCDDEKENVVRHFNKELWRTNYLLNSCCVLILGYSCHVNQQNSKALIHSPLQTGTSQGSCLQAINKLQVCMRVSLQLLCTVPSLSAPSLAYPSQWDRTTADNRNNNEDKGALHVSIYTTDLMLVRVRKLEKCLTMQCRKWSRWPQFLAGQLANHSHWLWGGQSRPTSIRICVVGWPVGLAREHTQFKRSNSMTMTDRNGKDLVSPTKENPHPSGVNTIQENQRHVDCNATPPAAVNTLWTVVHVEKRAFIRFCIPFWCLRGLNTFNNAFTCRVCNDSVFPFNTMSIGPQLAMQHSYSGVYYVKQEMYIEPLFRCGAWGPNSFTVTGGDSATVRVATSSSLATKSKKQKSLLPQAWILHFVTHVLLCTRCQSGQNS